MDRAMKEFSFRVNFPSIPYLWCVKVSANKRGVKREGRIGKGVQINLCSTCSLRIANATLTLQKILAVGTSRTEITEKKQEIKIFKTQEKYLFTKNTDLVLF